MRRFLVVALLALAFPGVAQAGPCGLPDGPPVWIDFAATQLESVFVKPGVVLATSTGTFPARVRDAGAKTIYWDMNLRNRVGTPTAPADPSTIPERAHRLFVFAASQTACATPWIVLNELFGAQLETPWTPRNAQYRENVLTLLRELAARGARPLLLLSRTPFTGTPEADAWWREAAKVSDLVLEVYFNARNLWGEGPVVANRRIRNAFRRAIGKLTAIGIPVTRIGLCLGFQVGAATGGREGLRPTSAWLEVVKWQTLSAKQVAAETKVATVVSWGWGTWSPQSTDPDKPRAACVYLWARNPSLCDGPAVAGRAFDRSRTEGQLVLRIGAQCRVGRATIASSAVARLTRLTGDRDVSLSVLYGRAVEARHVRADPRAVLDAERAIVRFRFAGSRGAYAAALARVGATVTDARGIIGDQLRRRAIAARLRVAAPTEAAIRDFYASYPDALVRVVHATRVPAWLGARRGLAISAFAPDSVFESPPGRSLMLHSAKGTYSVRVVGGLEPLATVPLAQARRSIAAGLRAAAKNEAAAAWSARVQSAELRETTCRRDRLPQVSALDLTVFAPFLALKG